MFACYGTIPFLEPLAAKLLCPVCSRTTPRRDTLKTFKRALYTHKKKTTTQCYRQADLPKNDRDGED